jgi:predicted ferric reductase
MLYSVVVLGPIGAAALSEPAVRSTQWAASAATALGFAALAVLTMQLALAARVRVLSRAVGLDALMQFHREMAVVGLVAAIAHSLLLGKAAGGLRAWWPVRDPWYIAAGATAIWLLVVIAITSFGRKALKLPYEAWHIIHLACAFLLVVAMFAHALGAGRYSGTPLVRFVLFAYGVLFICLLIHYRVVRPLRLLAKPWEITGNTDAGGGARLLSLRPIGHAGFDFAPGQFAWIVTGRSPLVSEQHPLSFASAPVALSGASVQFVIKALGDWSGSIVPYLPVGHRAWIDGPYGAFTSPLGDAPLMLIAGGNGIAPMRSILLAARAAGDRRRIVLFYAVAEPSRVALRDELIALSAEMNFPMVLIYKHPPAGWTGERGLLTAEMVRRHCPVDPALAEYLVCGPIPMVDAFDRIRAELGASRSRVHTERIQMV